MNKRTFLPLLALALCATILFPLANLWASGLPENPAPKAQDFTLVDAEGQPHKLSDYAGKYVVIEWLNHGCPFVQKHYNSKNMQSLQKKYTDKGVIWLSIISSAPGKQGHSTPEQALAQMAEKGASPTAVLIDEDGAVGKMYGARTTPHMFVVAPDQTVIYQGAIDNIRSADPEDVPNATNYVGQALDESMSGQPVSVGITQPYGCSVKY
ncbi:MAG: thioredoxin family protein [Armatimonadetes bacterium]|nr:thioredoxin family protein [Armatimonadota bacterium]